MSDSTTKIVTTDIPFGNVYAYRVGDKIDAAVVKANSWEEYVASPTSKAAQEVTGTAPTGSTPNK